VRIIHLRVDLARVGVALERTNELRKALARDAHEFENDHRGDDARIRPVVVAVVIVTRVLAAEDALVSAITFLMKLWPTRVRTGTPPFSRITSGTDFEQIKL